MLVKEAAGPMVQLISLNARAFDNFVATARTCYSPRGIVSADDVSGPPDQPQSELEKRRERKFGLAQSLFKAGHHTTLQHAHAQFALDRVSRHFIWSFLHSHPFYNSEQVSQRYVAVAEENFHVPPGLAEGRPREVFLSCVRRQMRDYQELCELLRPLVESEYYARFKGRYGTRRAAQDIAKRAQEVARYVLPIATHAYLYHTVSVITLFRYWRMCVIYDTPAEQRDVVGKMVEALLDAEPDFRELLQEPMPVEQTPEWRFFAQYVDTSTGNLVDTPNAKALVANFDTELNGATSTLADWGSHNEQVLAQGVREVLGVTREKLDDDAAIALALNPAQNTLLGESMNLTTLGKISRALFHPHYVFRKKLSHAADSQDQRHRMTPASRPILMRWYTGEPDYVTPAILRDHAGAVGVGEEKGHTHFNGTGNGANGSRAASVARAAAARRYQDSMEQTWSAVNELLELGVAAEDAAYLLPNAVSVRFTESADLLNLHHKMAMRLCYNAQEEIWQASLDEARAVERVNPRIGRWLLPPCGLRKHASQKPICPEGDRYCGVPVWRLQKEQYARLI